MREKMGHIQTKKRILKERDLKQYTKDRETIIEKEGMHAARDWL